MGQRGAAGDPRSETRSPDRGAGPRHRAHNDVRRLGRVRRPSGRHPLGRIVATPPVERTLANKDEAVSFAAYRALVDLFPTQTPAFNDVMASLGYAPANGSTDVTTPAGVGNVAAAAVIALRHHDGANQLGDLHPGAYSDYTGYVPVNDPDHINDPNRGQPPRFSDRHR